MSNTNGVNAGYINKSTISVDNSQHVNNNISFYVDNVSAEERTTYLRLIQTFSDKVNQADSERSLAQQEARTLADKLNITYVAITMFLETVGKRGVSVNELPIKLAEFAQEYNNYIVKVATFEDKLAKDVEVSGFISEAKNAIISGEYDLADDLLTKIEDIKIREGNKSLEIAAEARKSKAELAILSNNLMNAAEHYKKAIAILPVESDQRHSYLKEYAKILFSCGQYNGLVTYLRTAIIVWEQIIIIEENDKTKKQVRNSKVDLGLVHSRIGTMLGNQSLLYLATSKFEEAISGYQSLTMTVGSEIFNEYVLAKNYIGYAQIALGEITGEVTYAQEAVQNLDFACDNIDNVKYFQEWSQACLQLIRALAMLGHVCDDKELYYKRAVSLSRILVRSSADLERRDIWVVAQRNLGCALCDLAFCTMSQNIPTEALKTFNSALLFTDEKHQPQDWASIHSSIATFYMGLGFRQTRNVPLRKAQRHFNLALKYETQILAPKKWAFIQQSLGKITGFFANKEYSSSLTIEAISLTQKSMEVFTAQNYPVRWVQCVIDVGQLYIGLYKIDHQSKYIKKAFECFQSAMSKASLLHSNAGKNLERLHATSMIALGIESKDKTIVYDGLKAIREITEYYKAVDISIFTELLRIEVSARDFLKNSA